MDIVVGSCFLGALFLGLWDVIRSTMGVEPWNAFLYALLIASLVLNAVFGHNYLLDDTNTQFTETGAVRGQQIIGSYATKHLMDINTQDRQTPNAESPVDGFSVAELASKQSSTGAGADSPTAVIASDGESSIAAEQPSSAGVGEKHTPCMVTANNHSTAEEPASDQSSSITASRKGSVAALTENRYSDPEICQKVLRGVTYSSEESLGTNRLAFTVSRGIPHQRLVRAFGIDNGFTTLDDDYRRAFRSEAQNRLSHATKEGWRRIAGKALAMASSYAMKITGHRRHSLDQVVQIISLRMVLEALLGLDPDNLGDGDVLRIAEQINRLWIESKSSTESDAVGIEQFRPYFETLGIRQKNPGDNPLNLLLPAYETLWRLVGRCLIEVVFRPAANSEWLDVLKEFLKRPDDTKTFQGEAGGGKVPVLFLVKEALRLYPPTRRIYRAFHMTSKAEPEVIAADIEACHRLTTVWGDDSDKYKPARWFSANAAMNRAFMPFGGSPYLCPAGGSFAPRMIGVLVAAIASSISVTDWQLELNGPTSSSSRLFGDETELGSDRTERNEWFLVRK